MSKLQLGSRSSYSLDWFLTARNSQSWIKVGLAFFGASIGIWCFFPYFSYDNEISFKSQLIILLLSALAASYPVILLAYVGDIMKTKYPTARSVADYASLRFGKPVAIYVSCICIINLGKIFSIKKSNTFNSRIHSFRKTIWRFQWLSYICCSIYRLN
jgi:hypothetical protein